MKSSLKLLPFVCAFAAMLFAALSAFAAGITVSPALAAVTTTTQAQQFTASIQNVTWSVDKIVGGNSTVGTITTNGLYTPPAKPGNHTVTATSGNQTGSATISITDLSFILTYHNDVMRDG